MHGGLSARLTEDASRVPPIVVFARRAIAYKSKRNVLCVGFSVRCSAGTSQPQVTGALSVHPFEGHLPCPDVEAQREQRQ